MKKFLVFIGIIITTYMFVSCESTSVTDKKDFRNTEKIPWESITKYTYNNHNYIKFKDCEGYDGYAGVVHDPDCWCFTDTIITDTITVIKYHGNKK